MKATSIFGGVQIFNILNSIIRSKFIAVFLGPGGMGIVTLLTSTTGLIVGLTNFGLGISAVKDVAAAHGLGDESRIATVITVLKYWVWVTGTLGTLVMILFSPWLSQFTFGNRDYTIAFIWISVTLLLTQLTNCQLVILQGLQKLQYLAKASLAGSTLGMIFTIPLYYMFGIKGIVPVFIISSLLSFLVSWYYARKVKIEFVSLSRARIREEGKNMLSMGFVISMSGLLSLGSYYLVTIFISKTAGVSQVGLYSAGFAIINSYVGLIFNAMGTDYYPRLSNVAHCNELCKQSINQQAEIALLILSPILIVFLVFINWIIIIIYSDKFITVDAMLEWAALGMLFKATSWAMSFILLAKGASKLFFWNELITYIYMFILNILGYHYLGLTGLGISFLAGYLIYAIQIFVLINIKYNFIFDYAFISIFAVQLLLTISCFIVIEFIPKPASYFIGLGLIIISTWYSYKELDKRLGIKDVLNNIRNKILN